MVVVVDFIPQSGTKNCDSAKHSQLISNQYQIYVQQAILSSLPAILWWAPVYVQQAILSARI